MLSIANAAVRIVVDNHNHIVDRLRVTSDYDTLESARLMTDWRSSATGSAMPPNTSFDAERME